ncbi:hypothetical protein BPUTSESOX_1827 [uncultured Gammaproteobacteria bacterium]|nr:hypothetical protein [uncultured Gammaproteobacteria bacterium]VVH52453.1 hypothetical protein BPUTSESOX_1827 [uncultured Gammaproteobacteria bacterium]
MIKTKKGVASEIQIIMPQLSALSPWSQKMRNIHDNTKKLMTDISNKVVVIVRQLIDKSKENTTFTYTILTVAVVFILGVLNLIDTETKITYTSIISALIAIIGLCFFYRRLKNQEKQINTQVNQRIDERFNSAINLLGSSETSARTGAIYALHELAREEEKYRKQIAQILYSHIRSKTNEEEYQQKHNKRPSNEIQTTINLLFKENKHSLYTQDFARATEFPKADLSHAYLMGADFRKAQCQRADFGFAQCQDAVFSDAQCQGANFDNAQCQGVRFGNAQCQEASFASAQCQGADFIGAQCQRAVFANAQCQRADFMGAQCQGTDFMGAQCWGEHFREVPCQGALFSEAKFDTAPSLVLSGEINNEAIKAIENAKPYLDDSWYQRMQKIIKENKGKEREYGAPEFIEKNSEDSEEIQAITNKDWDKLEQLQNAKKVTESAKYNKNKT